MADRYWVGGTGNWDGADTTHWSSTSGGAGGASVPTSSDDVRFISTSGAGTVTLTAAAFCRNLIATNFLTIDTNNQNLTVANDIFLTGSGALVLGSSAISCVDYQQTAYSGTINAGTSSITVTGGLFNGGGFIYHDLTLSPTLITHVTVVGNNTFNTFTLTQPDATARTLFLGFSETQTAQTFSLDGVAGQRNTILSTRAGVQGNLSQAAGTYNGSWIILKDCNAGGGATWNADLATCRDMGNNAGWNFTGTPPPPYPGMFFHVFRIFHNSNVT